MCSTDQYLYEMLICFNSKLEIVDWDGVVEEKAEYSKNAGVITNCNRDHQIHYPSALPQHILDSSKHEI